MEWKARVFIMSILHMIKLAVGPSKYKLQRLLAALDLFNKVKEADSRITSDAATDGNRT